MLNPPHQHSRHRVRHGYTASILGSQRINYIGGLDENNRTRNLAMLQSILAQVVKRWPEIEFVSSQDLAKTINKQKNNIHA